MGRLIEQLDPFQPGRSTEYYPPLNLYESADHYILTVQVPGVSSSDIELTITGETLTMRGERKRPEGVKDDHYRRQERLVGRWSRTVTLPDRVDSALVTAAFSEGILTIHLPKAESAKPRHIAVSTGISTA
jgi:HSP20 family protein